MKIYNIILNGHTWYQGQHPENWLNSKKTRRQLAGQVAEILLNGVIVSTKVIRAL